MNYAKWKKPAAKGPISSDAIYRKCPEEAKRKGQNVDLSWEEQGA